MKYKIYRGADSVNVTLIDSTTAISASNAIPTYGTYYYRVSAVDSTGFEGARSYAVRTSAIASPGLVAWYPMNGTTNDSSGNGNNCTNNGATLTTDRFGNSGKAYALNGTSSYISAFNLSPINDISVSLWFKELSAASAGFLYSSGDGNNAIFNLSLDAGGKPDYLVSRMTANSLDGISSTTPTIGTWHHIVITRTNATVAMYLDDILQTITITLNQGSLVGAISNAIPLFFGAGNSSGSPNTFLTGSLDDIRLYNRVLRTGEIDTLDHDGGWPINLYCLKISLPPLATVR
jgi:hypothetical protein